MIFANGLSYEQNYEYDLKKTKHNFIVENITYAPLSPIDLF